LSYPKRCEKKLFDISETDRNALIYADYQTEAAILSYFKPFLNAKTIQSIFSDKLPQLNFHITPKREGRTKHLENLFKMNPQEAHLIYVEYTETILKNANAL